MYSCLQKIRLLVSNIRVLHLWARDIRTKLKLRICPMSIQSTSQIFAMVILLFCFCYSWVTLQIMSLLALNIDEVISEMNQMVRDSQYAIDHMQYEPLVWHTQFPFFSPPWYIKTKTKLVVAFIKQKPYEKAREIIIKVDEELIEKVCARFHSIRHIDRCQKPRLN